MSQRMLVATGLCLAGFVIGSVQTHAQSARLASSQSLALALRDVPAHFSQQVATSTSAAQLAKKRDTDSQIEHRDGFVTGYESAFSAPTPKTTAAKKAFKGLIYIDDTVSSYQTIAGAHKLYLAEVKGAMGDSRLKGFKVVSMTHVGQESLGYRMNTSTHGIPVTYDILVFRTGPYVAILAGGGVTNTLGAGDAVIVNLAKTVQQRMAAAH